MLCRCKRQCFTRVPAGVRDTIFAAFYREFETKAMQDSHLAGLIHMQPVKQRRPRVLLVTPDGDYEEGVAPNAASFSYTIRHGEAQIQVRLQL